MTTHLALKYFIEPVLEGAASRYRTSIDSPSARAMLLAVGLQESRLVETIQRGAGGKPLTGLARSWWQFEGGRNQALGGILADPRTAWARDELCHMGYPCLEPGRDDLHWCMAYDQRIGVILARALIWLDPYALPAPVPQAETTAWTLYIRCWRPGKPHHASWAANWRAAIETVTNDEVNDETATA